MTSYKYEDLESHDGVIRILTVLARDSDQQVNCLISTAKLSDRFSALSYTWGSADVTKEIRINGKPFTVRQNLFAFLDVISTQRPGTQVWIDAVCIDQANDKEKSHQVLQMGHIYAAASEVLIWLGKDEALQDWFAAIRGRNFADADSQRMDIPLGRRAWLEGFRLLMMHPYWTRLWITQEFLLGRNVMLLAGTSSISMKSFQYRYNLYRLNARNILDPGRAARIFLLLAKKYQNGEHFVPYSMGVRAAFELTADSVCQDQRDRVFGLVSLMEGGENFPLRYSDTVFAVFLRAIVQLNDKYMSCLLFNLLRPTPDSVHTDLKQLLKSPEHLDFHNVRLLRLNEVTLHSELCHRHLRDRFECTEDLYIWCIELLPKRNWQEKFLSHCTTLHIFFRKDKRSEVFRSTDAVCQRDLDLQQITLADKAADMVLSKAYEAVRDGAILAAKSLPTLPRDRNDEDARLHVIFPLSVLSQLFWYLLRPQLRKEDEQNGIYLWNGFEVFTLRLSVDQEAPKSHGEASSLEDIATPQRSLKDGLPGFTTLLARFGQSKNHRMSRTRMHEVLRV